MRIISGSLKGRRIPFNNRKQGNARVTSDFVKKAVFSSLGESLPGLSFLDLFAGSGQMGLEACSRGAPVVMNEPDRRKNRFIAGLLASWNLQDQIRLYALPAQKLIPRLNAEGRPFDILYLDPPYHETIDDTPVALAVLAQIDRSNLVGKTGRVVIQHTARLECPATLTSLTLARQKTYGETTVTLYKK